MLEVIWLGNKQEWQETESAQSVPQQHVRQAGVCRRLPRAHRHKGAHQRHAHALNHRCLQRLIPVKSRDRRREAVRQRRRTACCILRTASDRRRQRRGR